MKDYYKLSRTEKYNIAKNLVEIINKNSKPTNETIRFIANWILSNRKEKYKFYYDVWDIVLKNFYPKTRPILIRSISKKSKKEYIGSFTNSLECAIKYSDDKSYWIICDTKAILNNAKKHYKKGEYEYTFYPLSEVLRKAKLNDGWGFSEYLLDNYTGEDEYIMKINFSYMQLVKYIKQ